jgi:hypothetical protein
MKTQSRETKKLHAGPFAIWIAIYLLSAVASFTGFELLTFERQIEADGPQSQS